MKLDEYNKIFNYYDLNRFHKACLIIPVAVDVPREVTMLKSSRASQPMSSDWATRVVQRAGNIAPEGGVAAQSGIQC